MRLTIDIPDTMYDWLLHGYPDDEDYVKLSEIIRDGAQASGDCISRQDAIDILDDLACDYESGKWDSAHSEARGRMINLPSVETERKTAE